MLIQTHACANTNTNARAHTHTHTQTHAHTHTHTHTHTQTGTPKRTSRPPKDWQELYVNPHSINLQQQWQLELLAKQRAETRLLRGRRGRPRKVCACICSCVVCACVLCVLCVVCVMCVFVVVCVLCVFVWCVCLILWCPRLDAQQA